MIRKLKIKFVCVNMMIVMVMLTVIFGMFLTATNQNLERRSQHSMMALLDMPEIRDLPKGEKNQPCIVLTLNDRGIIGFSTNYYEEDPQTLLPIVEEVLSREEKAGVLADKNLRFARKGTPWGERVVLMDCSADHALMKEMVRDSGLIGLAAVAVFLGISVGLANWAVRPVERAWEQQRQFVADASHELKTPLTVIMTNAELLQDPGYDQRERGQFADSILVMSRQMRGLVEGLLNLARVDNGVVKTVFSELSFSALLEDALLPFEPLFFEKGLALSSDIAPGLRLRGSEAHLRQVVDILLDNASKYSLPGTVSLSLRRQGGSCLLCVSNPCGEFSREDLKNIFKRFYRREKARTMSGSYGLGLSIAEGIVRDHGGKIWAEKRENSIFFFVQLPVLPASHED